MRTHTKARRRRAYRVFSTGIRCMPDGCLELEIARGARRRAFEKDGTLASEIYESTAALLANLGDRVVVCGVGANDNNACVEVVGIDQHGYRERLRVRVVAGELVAGTTRGHVLGARNLRRMDS